MAEPSISKLTLSRHSLAVLIRSEFSLLQRPQLRHSRISSFQRLQPRSRYASTTSNSSKPIVLEQPDKFRPPSHSQRLTKSRPRSSPGGGYNQWTTESERDIQKNKRYPHMFPNEGTFMHWFLTNKAIHLWIAMGTLTVLASISLTQTFLHTSPYAHLFPSISSLPAHPINYVSEALAVLRLHIEYTTEKTAESRKQKILDAQKRRLYRRAHGMEDLDAEEEQGIDVRGLVPWDDGLTNKERARGGRDREAVTGRMVVEAGGKVGDDIDEFARQRRKARDNEQRQKQEGDAVLSTSNEGQGDGVEQRQEQEVPQKRKRKLWFGIW